MNVGHREKSAPFAVFESIADYDLAYPQAPHHARARSFSCAAAGLWDDLTVSGYKYTLDFLPSGEHEGVVVATRWGKPPILLLTGQVRLSWAWEVITKAWPTTLDSAARLLRAADE
ncbi:hypothetical protein [Amycolatopsis japonica]